MSSVTTVISMCSADRNFIVENVKAVSTISDKIIIPYSTHKYDGTPDDMSKIKLVKKAVKPYNVEFREFGRTKFGISPGQNQARWTGCHDAKTEWVLLLDTDELLEGDKLKEWFNKSDDLKNHDVITFAAYFYGPTPNIRACFTEKESRHFKGGGPKRFGSGEIAGLLVRKKWIHRRRIFNGPERWMFFRDKGIPENKKKGGPGRPNAAVAMDGSVMLHHYAYVRPKSEMHRKLNFLQRRSKEWDAKVNRYYSPGFKFDVTKDRDICHDFICVETTPPHEIITVEQFDKIYG